MKKILYLLIFIPAFCRAQWISKSAEGEGTILTDRTHLSLDLSKTDLSFSINNLNKPLLYNRLFFGGSVSGKNEEGLANLFSRGDFVPYSQLNAFVGLKFPATESNDAIKIKEYKNRLEEEALGVENQELQKKIILQYDSMMSIDIHDEVILSTLPDSIKNRISREWTAYLRGKDSHRFEKYLNKYLDDKTHWKPEVKLKIMEIIVSLERESNRIMERYQTSVNLIKKKLTKNYTEWIGTEKSRTLVFLYGGAEGSSFTRFDSINTTMPGNSFIKEEYRGGFIGIGVNYQKDKFNAGLTYAYRKTNNFDLLDKTDYKLTTTTMGGGQTLESEQEITAYSGDYGEVEINELNADISYALPMKNLSNDYVLLNAYVRGNLFSRNKILLPNYYNIGVASYFFSESSKFLGGLYIEMPDVNDSFEKSKPVTDRTIRPALRRLTFGVVSKFSLNSILARE